MICRVAKIVKMPDVEPVAFLLPGLRATLKKFVSKKHPLMVSVIPLPPVAPTADPHMASCVYEEIKQTYNKILTYVPQQDRDRITISVNGMGEDVETGVYFMATNSPLLTSQKAELLKAADLDSLLEAFLKTLDQALQRVELQAEIHMRTHQDMSRQQRRQFLQQQLKSIQDEIGRAHV